MELNEQYLNKLIGKIYICLPAFEGKSHISKTVVYNQEEAYLNYLKNLSKLKIEIMGCVNNYPDVVEFVEMYNIIEGLKSITANDHDILKQNVFNLIDICDKLKYMKSKE